MTPPDASLPRPLPGSLTVGLGYDAAGNVTASHAATRVPPRLRVHAGRSHRDLHAAGPARRRPTPTTTRTISTAISRASRVRTRSSSISATTRRTARHGRTARGLSRRSATTPPAVTTSVTSPGGPNLDLLLRRRPPDRRHVRGARGRERGSHVRHELPAVFGQRERLEFDRFRLRHRRSDDERGRAHPHLEHAERPADRQYARRRHRRLDLQRVRRAGDLHGFGQRHAAVEPDLHARQARPRHDAHRDDRRRDRLPTTTRTTRPGV